MQDFILLIACIFLTSIIGWMTLYILSGRKGARLLTGLEKIGLSYLFGFGIITIEMFLMSILGIVFTPLAILTPWILIGIIILATRVKKYSQKTPSGQGQPKAPNRWEITLFSLISIQTLYNFFRALAKPIESHDAISIYGIKSKMMYLSKAVSSDFFSNLSSFFQGSHPDYPLLIPLSETWVYTFLGRFNDLLVKAIFPMFYLSFVFVFYSILKRITKSRFVSLLFTFLLISVKQFSDYATIGYADLELGIYFAVSIFYLFLWMGDREKRGFFWISLVSSVFCIWTKNEGMMLALIAAGILLFYMLMNIQKTTKGEIAKIIIYALVILMVIVSWGIFKDSKGLANENFNLSMISLKSFAENLNRIPAILYEYQKQLFGFKKWNIIWVLFVFIFLKEFKTAFSGNIKYLTCTFLLIAIGYSLIYIFSAVGIKFLLSTTASRFLLHVLPVAVFWMVLIANKQKLLFDNA